MHGVMRERFPLYFLAGLASIFLSIWAAIKTAVINPDAICYLYSAEAMQDGLQIASHLCEQAKWPFYSMLIFGVTKLTHFSTITAAYCLNGFFSLISVLVFIAIVNTLTHRIRIIALSVVVILLAHAFNGLRVEIIRDHGFWAFYLLSLFFFLHYFIYSSSSNRWCYAVFWSISLIIATLFRIEGAVFLLLLPFVVLADRRQTLRKRVNGFLQLNMLTLLGGLALFLWMMLHSQPLFGRLPEVQFQFMHGLTQLVTSFQQKATALGAYVLNDFSARDAKLIFFVMLAVWYVLLVIANVSPIYAVLIFYAWCKKAAHFPREISLILFSYIFVNVLITSIFLVDNLFLSQRYLIALSLILMLWVPFALEDLILQWHKRKWPLGLAILLIAIYGIGSIFDFGHSKKYIREGGDWLATHATSNQKIYSNDYQLLYYSKHFGRSIFSQGKEFANLDTIANGKWQQYDYIALQVNHQELTKLPLLQEIKAPYVVLFQNDRGDQVRIYQTH